jgi:hypothetical protein
MVPDNGKMNHHVAIVRLSEAVGEGILRPDGPIPHLGSSARVVGLGLAFEDKRAASNRISPT